MTGRTPSVAVGSRQCTGASDASIRTAPSFESHVTRRLVQGSREYGDRSYERPLSDLLIEILEEAADIAAWGAIAATVLARSENLDDTRRRAIAHALESAEHHAAAAWRCVTDALAVERSEQSVEGR